MSDPTPDLTPEQDAVRRLLAEARHDGPTPPEVVSRLDDALASLGAERRDPTPDPAPAVATVVDLGARRRRLAGVGLLAAAVVVVAGVAIGQGLPGMQSSDDVGSAAGGDSATSSQRDFGSSDEGGGNLAETQDPEPENGFLLPGLAGFPHLLTFDDDLDEDLLDLRASRPKTSAANQSQRTAGCDLRGIGPGRRVQAQIDGSLGVVVFRRADGAGQQVDLYVCGDPQAVRTLTLPAP